MGVAGSGVGYGKCWPPLPASPIGLERRTAASGSCDWLNLQMLQADDEKESESEDDTANIYDDNVGAAVTEAKFNELFGESETDSDFEGF
ncbi:hypothetical protein UY3_07428 [Chelonia mydas]|uniref:Uncharacterized protein n=1 Tax=Chelonia mydas TaxID=8469 RepID=M7BE60_CHEMY|nr:hypothetical protein UY3_07428 [Chelonia mydas]